MIEIKFRAWDKKSKKIRSVSVLYLNRKGLYCPLIEFEGMGIGHEFSFDEVELMQYTGMYDEDGTELYTGDIIEDDQGRAVIKCAPGGFTIAGLPLAEVSNYGMKIIGNIYENPGLLEVK